MGHIERADVGAREAIGLSIRESRIVRIADPTGSQAAVLDEMADDRVTDADEREYWGTRASDGGAWRVHVVLGVP